MYLDCTDKQGLEVETMQFIASSVEIWQKADVK